jgi:hypothetical protein
MKRFLAAGVLAVVLVGASQRPAAAWFDVTIGTCTFGTNVAQGDCCWGCIKSYCVFPGPNYVLPQDFIPFFPPPHRHGSPYAYGPVEHAPSAPPPAQTPPAKDKAAVYGYSGYQPVAYSYQPVGYGYYYQPPAYYWPGY